MSNYYAVRKGRNTGIYKTWAECAENVNGFPRAEYKKFSTQTEALAYMNPMQILANHVEAKEYCYIFADGSFRNQKAGYGVVFPDGQQFCGLLPLPQQDWSNQSAELYAIYFAARKIDSENMKDCVIVTDSEYSINACTNWVNSWKKNGWRTSDGGAVKHQILISAIDGLLQRSSIRLEWIKGHANNAGNELADKLAKSATAP